MLEARPTATALGTAQRDGTATAHVACANEKLDACLAIEMLHMDWASYHVVTVARRTAAPAAPMRILVCGASGWAGQAVVADLVRHGHFVRGLDTIQAPPAAAADLATTTPASFAPAEHVIAQTSDLTAVATAMIGCDAVIDAVKCPVDHSVAGRIDERYKVLDSQPWLVHLQGLWNILDSARQGSVRRVVHIGSCQSEWPHGGAPVKRFTSEVRSTEGDIYGITKRLQEEMCRQYYDAHGLPIIVLRCGICDSWGGVDVGPSEASYSLRKRDSESSNNLYSDQAICRSADGMLLRHAGQQQNSNRELFRSMSCTQPAQL